MRATGAAAFFLVLSVFFCGAAFGSNLDSSFVLEKTTGLYSGKTAKGESARAAGFGRRDELPLEVVYRAADAAKPPVVREIVLDFGPDAAPEDLPDLVEIYVNSGGDFQFDRQVFRGRPVSSELRASLYPESADKVVFRYFSSALDGEARIPTVRFFGDASAVPSPACRKAGRDELSYLIYFGDQPAGIMWMDKENSGESGMFSEEYFYDTEVISPDEDESLKILSDVKCESEVDAEDMSLKSFECQRKTRIDELEYEIETKAETNKYGELEAVSDVKMGMGRKMARKIVKSFSAGMSLESFCADRSISDPKLDAGLRLVFRLICGERVSFKTSARAFEEEAKYVTEEFLFAKIASEGLAVGKETELTVLTAMDLREAMNGIAEISGKGKGATAACDDIKVTAKTIDFFPARDGDADLYAVWVFEKNHDKFNQLALIEADGAVIRKFDYIKRHDMRLAFDPDPEKIKPAVIDINAMIEDFRKSAKGNFIATPDGVERATAKISWSEATPDKLKLEGPRQRLISVKEVEPGLFEAEIETIRRLPGDEPLVPSRPSDEADLDSYLVADSIIQTEDASLVKLARSIVGAETDPMEISKKIFNWLIRNIEPKDVNAFYVKPASAILMTKSGDCKHFAVLFATLARISGVPTRFVFGQRYIAGEYGYHVWNQIHVDGEWLDVDASNLAFFPGALHIQLDTASSFNEKGHIGVALGVRPTPDLAGVEEGPLDSGVIDTGVRTYLDDATYQDAFYKFKVRCPKGMRMKVLDLGFARKIMFISESDPTLIANMYLSPDKKNSKKKADVWDTVKGAMGTENVYMTDLFGALKKAKHGKSGETTIGGKKAEFFTASAMDHKNQFIKLDVTALQYDLGLVYFHFAAPSDTFSKHSSAMSAIKSSIEFF